MSCFLSLWGGGGGGTLNPKPETHLSPKPQTQRRRQESRLCSYEEGSGAHGSGCSFQGSGLTDEQKNPQRVDGSES